MSKLIPLFEHCFKVAEKISESGQFQLSKGVIDIPGLGDSQGRSPYAEFPILSSEKDNTKYRILFTYDFEISADIDGNTKFGNNRQFVTPWLRMVYKIHDIDKVNFYRIHKKEKLFFNTLKKTLFITPGKELNSSSTLKNYYYLDCSINKDDIINKIQISDILSELEHFPNLKMIRIDSRELIVDIKCEEKEQYTEELVLGYIKTLDNLMTELLKV